MRIISENECKRAGVAYATNTMRIVVSFSSGAMAREKLSGMFWRDEPVHRKRFECARATPRSSGATSVSVQL